MNFGPKHVTTVETPTGLHAQFGCAVVPEPFDYEAAAPDHEFGYRLQWLNLMTYRGKSYVWYGFGQWDGHIMDWRGCNFYHGRIPGSPTFRDGKEALAWAVAEIKRPHGLREGLVLAGHHAGENGCRKGCGQREVHVDTPETLAGRSQATLYLNWTKYMPGVVAEQKRILRRVEAL